jgi:adenylosuccinate synthase
MQEVKTQQEAINFIFQSIKKIDPDNTKITYEDVNDLFNEFFDEKIEKIADTYLNEIDKNIMSENIDDEIFINNYLAQRIPKYYEMITDTVVEIMKAYINPA